MPLFINPFGYRPPDDARPVVQSGFRRLTSGYRVPAGSAEPATLALRASTRERIRAYLEAQRSAAGALERARQQQESYGEVGTVIARMRELASGAAAADATTSSRGDYDAQIQELKREIERLSRRAPAPAARPHGKLGLGELGLDALDAVTVSGASPARAETAVAVLDGVLKKVDGEQAATRSLAGRLHHAIAAAKSGEANLAASTSDDAALLAAEEASVLRRAQALLEDGVGELAHAERVARADPRMLN